MIPSVTYVDTDRRAARYFADQTLVTAELEGRIHPGAGTDLSFLQADYTTLSHYRRPASTCSSRCTRGPVWDHCQQYLAPSVLLLANSSHGDASPAALDPSLKLVAAVHHRDDKYRLDTSALDSYLEPRRPATADPELIRRQGRGIGYTRTAFAYIFRLA